MKLGWYHRRRAIEYVALAAPRLEVGIFDGQVLEHVVEPRRHRQVVVVPDWSGWFVVFGRVVVGRQAHISRG